MSSSRQRRRRMRSDSTRRMLRRVGRGTRRLRWLRRRLNGKFLRGYRQLR
jgi:hypothetical protein